MQFLRRLRILLLLAVRTARRRMISALVTVLSISLMTVMLTSFLSMANGLETVLEASGAEDVAIIARSISGPEMGSSISLEQQRLIASAPGVRVTATGRGDSSPELYVVVDGTRKSDGRVFNLALRGLNRSGMDMRKDVRLVRGRYVGTGTNEIMVGESAASRFRDYDFGDSVRLGRETWQVVGIFSTNGSVAEDEIWADLPVVQARFDQGAVVQTVRVRLEEPSSESLSALSDYLSNDPRLQLEVASEKRFYAEQIQDLGVLLFFAWAITILLSLGVIAGTTNAMIYSIGSRSRELATLRALGFQGSTVYLATIIEAVVLAALGLLVGIFIYLIFLEGRALSTIGANFTQIGFRFSVSITTLASVSCLALIVGVLGATIPGAKAASSGYSGKLS